MQCSAPSQSGLLSGKPVAMREFGLIGYPLGHSFSARYFNEKFAEDGLDCSYSLFPIEEIGQLPGLIEKHPDLMGFNVTIPYKEKVIGYLKSLSDDAAEIGAVNVVSLHPEPKGYNTDWQGFAESIKPLLRNDVTKHCCSAPEGLPKPWTTPCGVLASQ